MRVTFRRSLLTLLVIALGLMPLASTVSAQALVFPPDATPFGTGLPEWSAEWWQLILSIPTPVNPLVDATGDNCMVGQRGAVWFLTGTLGGTAIRSCSIPADKALFFPIINLVDVNVGTQSAAELRAEIAPCFDGPVLLSATLDGRDLAKRLDRFRVQSTVFDITVPSDGLLPAGTYSPAVADGFYLMLKPLAAGTHTLHFAGTSVTCDFSVDVTYHLTIVPVTLQ